MALTYVKHEKLSLQKSEFNEKWLHDRICDDPTIIGLGDLRVLAREKTHVNAGRLDLLLFDEDNNRRYEVEVMLGATDPSHIIRTIEYWDIERRRYPGYEHAAVLIAENITARFLNVISLLSGSIPLIAIQLDAISVGENIVLNFIRVLDQTDLRIDDTIEESGGGETDRNYWNQKAGVPLMQICDEILVMINEVASSSQQFNYLQHYIGLRTNGIVKNFIWFSPKPTKKIVHVGFKNSRAAEWKERFERAGVPSQSSHASKLSVSLTTPDFATHKNLLHDIVIETVKEYDE
jgi:hypothetical protein